MIKSKTLKMTEGEPIKLLIVFAIPMLIGNIFQQVYNLVDSIIVGRFVGADALAAVGATSSITFLFFALCNGIGNGGGIITAQYFGAGEEDTVKSSIANVGYLMLANAIMVGGIAYAASEGILRILGTPDTIMDMALIYMRMQCIGVPLLAIYNYSASMLRALGDSRTPLYFLIFSSFLNAGMDLLFVCVFHMGIFGAALATAISQFIAGSGCFFYATQKNSYFRMNKRHLKPNKKIIFEAIRIGIPLALQYSLIAISCMALQRVVNSFGAAAMAAFTATSRMEQLLHQPYGSLSMALSTYSGQNIGAKNLERVKLGYRKSLIIMGVFSLLMLPIMQFGGDYIIKIFVKEPEVISLGSTALKITSWFYVFLGIIYVTRGMLNGCGDAAFAFINGIVEMVGRIFIPVGLIMIPFIGVWGIWWSTGLTWMISAIFCVLRYFSWKRKTGSKNENRIE